MCSEECAATLTWPEWSWGRQRGTGVHLLLTIVGMCTLLSPVSEVILEGHLLLFHTPFVGTVAPFSVVKPSAAIHSLLGELYSLRRPVQPVRVCVFCSRQHWRTGSLLSAVSDAEYTPRPVSFNSWVIVYLCLRDDSLGCTLRLLVVPGWLPQ